MTHRTYIIVKKELSHSQLADAKNSVLNTGVYKIKGNHVLVSSTGAYIGYIGITTLELVQDDNNSSARSFRKNLEKIFKSVV